MCWPSGKLPTDLCPQMNRYTSFYAAEQIPADPKDQAKVADTWWQKIAIDTRTGLRATSDTPPAFVTQQVRLVFPPEEIAGWGGLRDWAAKAGVLSLLAPDDPKQQGALPAFISNPQAGQGVTGTVTVVGRADSPDFLGYTLEWGRGAQPTSWVRIAGSSSKEPGGTLGSWDVRDLPNGPVTLRVRLDDKKLGTRIYAVPLTIGGGQAGDSAPTLVVTAGPTLSR